MNSVLLKRVVCVVLISVFAIGAMVSYAQDGESAEQVRYEALVDRSEQLNGRKESIESDMKGILTQIEQGDNSTQIRGRYLDLELELLALRAEISTVSDSVALMSLNLGRVESRSDVSEQSTIEGEDVSAFSNDGRFKSSLNERDMERLKESESLENSVSLMVNRYISAINELSRVRDSYNQATNQQSGLELKSRYDSLRVVATDLGEDITEDWDYIYDNKSYSYDLLLSVNSMAEQSRTIVALRDSTLNEGAEWSVEPYIAPIKSYILQKSELLKVEIITSRAFGLSTLADSLSVASEAFSKMGRNYPSVELEERTFIDYRDAEILKSQIYTSSNPIPVTKIYEHGVIYRIRVGNFSKKQPASLFRLSSEVSYVAEKNNTFTYYIGGYQSYAEAVKAQSMLKSAGFRRPEVVVWSSGKLRNLAENPYSQSDSYRLEISGREAPSDAMRDEIMRIASGVTISKMGATNYAIAPIYGEGTALQLSQIVASEGEDIVIELKKIEN